MKFAKLPMLESLKISIIFLFFIFKKHRGILENLIGFNGNF
jgi:hypothetical protein